MIPVGARNKRTAEAFMDYILRPDVIARISTYHYYANPNAPAQDLLDPALKADTSVYPPSDVLERSEFYEIRSPSANRLVNRIWARLLRERQ